MEVVNNITSAASRAIWGEQESQNPNATSAEGTGNATTNNTSTEAAKKEEIEKKSGEEPISGVLGDTKKGEPFDGGNLENPTTSTTSTSTTPSTKLHSSETTFKPLDSTSPTATTDSTLTKDLPLHPKEHQNDPSPLSNITTSHSSTGKLPPSADPTPQTDDATALKETPVSKEIKNTSTSSPSATTPSTSETSAPSATSANTTPAQISNTTTTTATTPISATPEISSTKNNHSIATSLAPKDKDTESDRNTALTDKEKDIGFETKGGDGSGFSASKSASEHATTSTNQATTTSTQDFDASKPGAGKDAQKILSGKSSNNESLDSTGNGGDIGGKGPHSSPEGTAGGHVGSEGGKDDGGHAKEGKLSHLKEKIKEKLHKGHHDE